MLLILFGLSAGSVFAQKYEVDPYAGGFFPTSSESVGRFRNEGMYGVRGGLFTGDHFEFGGNFDYITHFDLKQNNPTMLALDAAGLFRPTSHAIEYGMMMRYNFAGPTWFGPPLHALCHRRRWRLDVRIHGLSNDALNSNNNTIATMNANNGTNNTNTGFNNSSVFFVSGVTTTVTNNATTSTNPFGTTTSTSNDTTSSTNPFGPSTTTISTTTTTTGGNNPFGNGSNAATTNVAGISNTGFVMTNGDNFLTLTYGFGIKARVCGVR